MATFRDRRELETVMGGFLQTFPKLSPVLQEVVSQMPLILKLELKEPELTAEIDFTKSPLEVRMGANGDGIIGLAASADHFHQVLLGMIPLGLGIDRRQLLMRGSIANLIAAAPLFYLAPAIYPIYLESIGRADLVLPGLRLPLHGETKPEDSMTKIVSSLAWLAGYSLGFLKTRIAPRLDLIAALESMGNGLRSARPAK